MKRIFTDAEAARVKLLIKSGATLDGIKTEFRCSRAVLYREMRRLKIKPLRKPKVKFTPEEIAAIVKAARAGQSSLWIADELGRGRAAVICAARRHGVPFVDPRRLKHLVDNRKYFTDSDPFDVDPNSYAAFIEAGKAELARGRA